MPRLPEALYTRCWDHWWDLTRHHKFVVKNKMPIPYFGDVNAFMESSKRIVTVGVNPNSDKFDCTHTEDRLDARETERRLSSYFVERQAVDSFPGSWFANYEMVLAEMDCSYLGSSKNKRNTALHADICSPIATPKWSDLSRQQKALLIPTGTEIFRDLVRALKPHLILMSVGKEHVERIWTMPNIDDWDELLPNPIQRRVDGTLRRHPYHVRHTRLPIEDGWTAHAIWAQSSIRGPFGSISDEGRVEIGRRAAKVLGE